VHLAAVAVRERALRLAGHLLEVDVADLELAEGRVKVKGTPQPARSLAELAAAAAPGAGPRPDGMEPGLAATQYYENAATPFAFGVHVAQVEVEPATGQVTVTRYVVAHDAGVLINPLLAEGQIAGGVAQGSGGALMEELRYAPDGAAAVHRLPGLPGARLP